MLHKFSGRNVLLLQGPVGPFFRRFATEIEQAGAKVTKINFNAGDALFYFPKPARFYRKAAEGWPSYLETVLRDDNIQDIFLFGDCRAYHQIAKETAEKLGIDVYVFEEGYLRPDYITIERGGVNGNSQLPKDPSFFLSAGLAPRHDIRKVEGAFFPFALYSGLYALAHCLSFFAYPGYRHHRSLNVLKEGPFWLKGAYRKLKYRFKESDVQSKLTGELSKKYYLVALQVHLDSQLDHTDYRDITDFISEVVASFAKNADPQHALVIKHHPLDRGYRDYSALLRDLGARHGISSRIFYVHDLHLPTLLKNALGTVMMNSTVGISSIHHGTPVKLLGRAVYDIPGLTFQGPLDDFWHDPGSIDRELFDRFVGFLQRTNQPNGNFYTRIKNYKNYSGIFWCDFYSFYQLSNKELGTCRN